MAEHYWFNGKKVWLPTTLQQWARKRNYCKMCLMGTSALLSAFYHTGTLLNLEQRQVNHILIHIKDILYNWDANKITSRDLYLAEKENHG